MTLHSWQWVFACALTVLSAHAAGCGPTQQQLDAAEAAGCAHGADDGSAAGTTDGETCSDLDYMPDGSPWWDHAPLDCSEVDAVGLDTTTQEVSTTADEEPPCYEAWREGYKECYRNAYLDAYEDAAASAGCA